MGIVDDIKSAEAKVEKENQKLFDLSQTMVKYSDEIEKLKSIEKEQSALTAEAELKFKNLQDKVSGLQDSLKQLEAAIVAKNEELHGLDHKINNIQADHSLSINNYNATVDIRQKRITELSGEIIGLESDFEDKKRVLEIEKQNLLFSNNAIRVQIEERKEFSEEISNAINGLIDKKKLIIQDVNEQEVIKGGLSAEISALKGNLSGLQVGRSGLSSQVSNLELVVNNLIKEIAEKRKNISLEEADLEKKKIENANELKKIESLNESLKNRELNVKYRELKVQKLIRDKRLQDEIEELSSGN